MEFSDKLLVEFSDKKGCLIKLYSDASASVTIERIYKHRMFTLYRHIDFITIHCKKQWVNVTPNPGLE